jgi:hypothetical protein
MPGKTPRSVIPAAFLSGNPELLKDQKLLSDFKVRALGSNRPKTGGTAGFPTEAFGNECASEQACLGG